MRRRSRFRSSARSPVRRAAAVLTLLAAAAAATASAQIAPPYVDARLVPRGALRLSFEPRYQSFNERFASDGTSEAIGTDLSADSAGVRLFPTAAAAELAVRSMIADASYTMSAGRFRTTLDADIRHFPFNVSVGLADWLTFQVSVPIVTTRMQADLQVDSATANIGLNQAAALAGNAAAIAQIQLLLGQLEAGAASVEAQIAAGAFGCPSSSMCDQARALVARARGIRSDLIALTGVPSSGAAAFPLPPFAPLATSTAGLAILGAIQSVSTDLQNFGASALTATLPLPGGRPALSTIDGVLGAAEFGYDALPIAFAKLTQRLGDMEVGLRAGFARGRTFRTVVRGTVRLPTGTRDRPHHFTDLGSGDRQTDVEFGLEMAWDPGSVVSLGIAGSYTLQLPDRLVRRVTAPEQPIAPASTELLVERNLGDIMQLSVFPALRLSPSFTAYFSGHYVRRASDRFALAPDAPATVVVNPDDLARETAQQMLSFGGGVYFRPPSGRGGRGLPVEAGIDYRAAFRGDGGLTPKTRTLNFYARLFYRLFGGGQQAAQ